MALTTVKSPKICLTPDKSMLPNASPWIVMSPTAVAQAATSWTCSDLVAVKPEKEQALVTDGVAVVRVESGS